jgi:hypothetical protein
VKLIYRPIDAWPGQLTQKRQGSPFSASWSSTQDLLDKELIALGTREAVLQLAVPESAIYRDGSGIKADRKEPEHPGVILSFTSKAHGPLRYSCDRFDGWYRRPGWQENVRAIALGLESLRRVERYGIATRGEQYTGWKALGSGIPMPAAAEARMSPEEAARFIARHSQGAAWDGNPDEGWEYFLEDPDVLADLYRVAAKRLHPDTGGSTEEFQRLQSAKRVLEDEHSRALA